jgi:tripartite-type tricarboxylate transporter receptor subunit TctC
MKKHYGRFFLSAVLLSLAIGFLQFPGAAMAEYPERPITLLVAFAPGGSMDISTRAMAAAAERYLGSR